MTVNRICRAFGLRPHRSETFKLSPDPLLIEKSVRALEAAIDEFIAAYSAGGAPSSRPRPPTRSWQASLGSLGSYSTSHKLPNICHEPLKQDTIPRRE